MNKELIINIYSLASIYMVAIIWMTQLVTYPSFKYINKNQFSQFHSYYLSSIRYIIVPTMLIEFLCGLIIVFIFDTSNYYLKFSFWILILIWLLTFGIHRKQHKNISYETNTQSEINNLIKSNWIRTILWTIKAGIILRGIY